MIRYTKVPHSIRILLTNKCNLHCKFCFVDASSKADKEELTTTEWLNFFERLKELLIFNVSLSGGEIFLRNDLFVLLRKLRENLMHKITLLSNGSLITEEIANKLRNIDIKNISISVDGLEEKHNQIRGSQSFQKTIKGIQNLLSIGIKPLVSFTPIKSNYKDLGPLIDFVASLGITLIGVNTLTPHGRCLNIYEDIRLEYPKQLKEVIDVVEEKRRKYPNVIIDHQLSFFYNLPQSYLYFKKNPQNYKIKHLKDGCGAASTSCTITPSGDVIPCEGLSRFNGGNIRENDLLHIWSNSKTFKRIRALSKIAMDQVPYCKDCKYIFLCDGGCRASAYLVNKSLLAPTNLCPFWVENQAVKNPITEKSLKGDYSNA